MASAIVRSSTGSPEDVRRKRRSISYRINGYADLGGQRRSRHRNQVEAFHRAEALLHIHQVLNSASGLPVIRTAPPPRVHTYNGTGTRKQLATVEGSSGSKSKAPIFVTSSTLAKKTLKHLTFCEITGDTPRRCTASRSSSKYEKAVTSPWTLPHVGTASSDSKSETRAPAASTNRGSPMWSLVSEYSRKGGRHDAILPPHLDLDRSVVKCRAWLQSCDPWWRINDEYPVELTTQY